MARVRAFDAEETNRCNEKQKEESCKFTETISYNYLVEGLVMGADEIESVKKVVLQNLQSRRKLCLVLDLDHTLLHTKRRGTLTPQQKLHLSHSKGDDLYRWKLMGEKFYTKLRPFVRQFLKQASEMFELYVYTMGSRDYALHIVEQFLDPEGVYFGNRVIAREDCTVEGHKGLDVVPVHESGVLVLDDTESVWKRHSGNLIVIDKYDYYKEVGGDESEVEGELSSALEVLTKLHSVYFEWCDRFMAGDVRELLQYYYLDIVNDEGQQEIGMTSCSSDTGKHLRVDDELSSVTKRQRIC